MDRTVIFKRLADYVNSSLQLIDNIDEEKMAVLLATLTHKLISSLQQ